MLTPRGVRAGPRFHGKSQVFPGPPARRPSLASSGVARRDRGNCHSRRRDHEIPRTVVDPMRLPLARARSRRRSSALRRAERAPRSCTGALVGNVTDTSQARRARRHRDPHQHQHEPRARGDHQRRGHATASSTCSPGPTRSASSLTGFKEYVKDGVPGLVHHRHPRRRRRSRSAPSRRPITVQSETSLLQTDTGDVHAQLKVQGDHEPAARELPELPEPREPRPGRDARGVPERDHRHPRARAHHERQRHGPQQQQHPARRRHQHLRLAAAPRGLRRAGGHGGHGQRDDRQLRRRAGDGRRRLRHRPHQVRHQRVPRHRLLAARGRQPAGAQLGQLRATSPTASATSAASRSAAPSSRTSCSSSGPGRATTRRRRTRGRGPLPTAAMRAGDFSAFGTTIYDPATGNAGRHGPHPVPEQRHPRQPDQLDRAGPPVAAAAAERPGHVQQLHRPPGRWTSTATTTTSSSTTTSAPRRRSSRSTAR